MKQMKVMLVPVLVVLAMGMVMSCGGASGKSEKVKVDYLGGEIEATVTKLNVGKPYKYTFSSLEEVKLSKSDFLLGVDMPYSVGENLQDFRTKLFVVDIKKNGSLSIWTEGDYDTLLDVVVSPNNQKSIVTWVDFDGDNYEQNISKENLNARFTGEVVKGRVYISVSMKNISKITEDHIKANKVGFTLHTEFK